MTSVAILTDNGIGKDEVDVKKHLIEEFRENDIDVIDASSFDSLQECKCVILFYNTYSKVTTGFEEIARKLVELNIKPIVLIINAQNADVDYVKVGESLAKVWGDINPTLYCNDIISYFYNNDSKTAYQVNTGEEYGVSELIYTIKMLRGKMKFF